MGKYNDELNVLFQKFSQEAVSSCGYDITKRDIAIAKLTASFMLKNEHLIADSVVSAKQQGLSNSDIGKVSAITLERQAKAIEFLLSLISDESCCAPQQNDGCCS